MASMGAIAAVLSNSPEFSTGTTRFVIRGSGVRIPQPAPLRTKQISRFSALIHSTEISPGKHRVSSSPEIGRPSRCQDVPVEGIHSHAVETAPPARFHSDADRGRWQWRGAGRRVVAFLISPPGRHMGAVWWRRLVLQSRNTGESISLTKQESASTEHAKAVRWSSRQHLDGPQHVCGSRKLNNRDDPFGLGHVRPDARITSNPRLPPAPGGRALRPPAAAARTRRCCR